MKLHELLETLSPDITLEITTGDNIYHHDEKNAAPAYLLFTTVDIITRGAGYDLTIGVTENENSDFIKEFIDNYKGGAK